MAARSSYGVAAQPGCAARASAAALRTSAAVALPTLVISAPVAGPSTSSDPPAAFRHSVPKTRPRQVSSTRNFPAGAFIAVSLPVLDPCRLLPPKAMLGWALRDIQKNIARFQPGHSRVILPNKVRHHRNRSAPAGFPLKSRPDLSLLAFVLFGAAEHRPNLQFKV